MLIPYSEAPPSHTLADIVECFWRLEAESRDNAPAEPIFPDGCTELIFNLADHFCRYHSDVEVEAQAKVLIIGQMKKHVTIQPTGQVRLFGIRFKPGGLFPILRMPLSELTNQILSLKLIPGPFAQNLEEQMHACGSFHERIRLAESFLSGRLKIAGSKDAMVNELIRRIIQTEGRAGVGMLSQDIGLSHRQIERRFRKQVGISPKMFARIIRFQAIFAALEQPSPIWSQIALGRGYYDQAHLIHDFKAFSGTSPAAFIARQVELTAFFMRKNRTSFFYNTGK